MPVPPRNVNDVSFEIRTTHEIHSSWQAQYLVKLQCHFSWQAQCLVKSEGDSCCFAHCTGRFMCCTIKPSNTL